MKTKKTKSSKRWVQSGVLILALILGATVNSEAQFVHTQGTQIVDGNGVPIFLCGPNIGNWLLWEGYMMNIDVDAANSPSEIRAGFKKAFGNDETKTAIFEAKWRDNYVTNQTMADIKALGFNAIRVPFHYNMFWNGTTVKDDGFIYFDKIIQYCKANNLYVLFDMHCAPGYQNWGEHSDNTVNRNGVPDATNEQSIMFWRNWNNVDIASAVWRHIANHYKDESTIWGWDILNEPVMLESLQKTETAYLKLQLKSYKQMTAAIREVDPNHIIVAEGIWWGCFFNFMQEKWDNNLVFETHHYPGEATSDPINTTSNDGLNERLAMAQKVGVPLILGEFGENMASTLRVMTDWCVTNGVGYFPWSFKRLNTGRAFWSVGAEGTKDTEYEKVASFIRNGSYGTPPANAYTIMMSFCDRIANGNANVATQNWYINGVKLLTPPCLVLKPSNASAFPKTQQSIELTWIDNALNETGYNIKRYATKGGAILFEKTLPANTVSYIDNGLNASTHYYYTISAVGNCTQSVETEGTTLCGNIQQPYSNTPATVPGTIQAENFDKNGCPGASGFYDKSSGNIRTYFRTSEDVDIEQITSNQYAIGWIEIGEWVDYTVNVTTSGNYSLKILAASDYSGTIGSVNLKIGNNILTSVDLARTYSWTTYQNFTSPNQFNLAKGTQVIRMYFNALEFNLDSFELILKKATGLSNQKSEPESSYAIYPNPAKDVLNIESSTLIKSFKIYSCAGNTEVSEANDLNRNIILCDIASLPKGLYFIRLEDYSSIYKTLKFIIQ